MPFLFLKGLSFKTSHLIKRCCQAPDPIMKINKCTTPVHVSVAGLGSITRAHVRVSPPGQIEREFTSLKMLNLNEIMAKVPFTHMAMPTFFCLFSSSFAFFYLSAL